MNKGLFMLILPALCACSSGGAGTDSMSDSIMSGQTIDITTPQPIAEQRDMLDSIADALNENSPVACGDYIDIVNASYDGKHFVLTMQGNSGHLDFSQPWNKDKLAPMLRADLHKYYGEIASELARRGQPLVFDCYLDEGQIPVLTMELSPAELQPLHRPRCNLYGISLLYP